MVRYAATYMDSLKEAIVGAIMNINWKVNQFSEETTREFTGKLKHGAPLIYQNKQWKKA